MTDVITAYQQERKKTYDDHRTALAACDDLEEKIRCKRREQEKLIKAQNKSRKGAQKAKAKARDVRLRKKREAEKERYRIKDERYAFWPKKVYKVTIVLEATGYTPATSRRGSVDSDTTISPANPTFPEPPKESLPSDTINLSLAYMIHGASWSPRYDLTLNTVSTLGSLDYNAELRNTTSESWREAKVILSTSQAAFSGLSEIIPHLDPWHVRLSKPFGVQGRNSGQALMSNAELQAKREEWSQNMGEQGHKPRRELFGRPEPQKAVVRPEHRPLFNRQQNNAQPPPPAPAPGGRFGPNTIQQSVFGNHTFGNDTNTNSFGDTQQAGGASLFGGGNAQQTQSSSLFGSLRLRQARGGSLFGWVQTQQPSQQPESNNDRDQGEPIDIEALRGEVARHVAPLADEPDEDEEIYNPTLSFEEGAWEETGMTTTYDIPGLKTLAPSNSATKYRIAKVEFKNIVFSHTVIGKLRQVAFLKAKLRNSSTITLLKGPSGLALDGSFLGRTTFPRCSPGETLSLPLGIDPSISVNYAKPTVRRSQSGIFSKEDSNIFTRTCIVRNTRPNKISEITVLDQVPMSDERLKIHILEPQGLELDGRVVSAGSGVEDGNGNWGSAKAELKNGGEVTWWLKLDGNKTARLALQYAAISPGSETMVGL